MEAKLNLRLAVTSSDAEAYVYEDDWISALITAAREYVEHYTDQRLVSQVWECYLDAWPASMLIELPENPVISVDEIVYNGTEAFTDYHLDPADNIVLDSKPDAEITEVKVTYTVGFATVPSAAKIAMQLLIGNGYNNREAVVIGVSPNVLPLGVNSMLDTIRRFN